MFYFGCNATYIGETLSETGQHFNEIMSSHRTHINHAEHRKLQVSDHIFRCTGTQNLAIKFYACPFIKMSLNY